MGRIALSSLLVLTVVSLAGCASSAPARTGDSSPLGAGFRWSTYGPDSEPAHWEQGKMPPTVREGLMFVDDSQILPSLEAMVAEFEQWGRAFAPAPVAFQYGYESDRPWWERLADPPGDIGREILARVPNAAGLYWVDFTVMEMFPPARE